MFYIYVTRFFVYACKGACKGATLVKGATLTMITMILKKKGLAETANPDWFD